MSAPSGGAGGGRVQPTVALRPLANPLPLGFLGQALASWAFASIQLEWLSSAQSHIVAFAVLVFTVPLQGLASVLGFLARDPIAGPAVASFGRVAAAAVLIVAVPRFAVTGVAELMGSQGWLRAAGWVGLLLCAVSVYAALAFELEAATGRAWLPIGRVAGRSTRLADEAGVRRSL